MRYTVRLGEAPVGGDVELRVSGAYLEYEPVLVFTEDNFDTPQVVSIVMYENADITGDYWMDLVHTFTSLSTDLVDGRWWTTREPLLSLQNGSWSAAKLWCEESGAAVPLDMAVLIVDNDIEFPDAVVWELDTLVAGSTDELERGPFTLDATFFSRTDSGFWSEGEPDAAFRIEGIANGTYIYRPCEASLGASCSTTCVWTEVVWHQNNLPTIFVAFDDPCFVDYPPASGESVDLYAWVRTDSSDLEKVSITMERGIDWQWQTGYEWEERHLGLGTAIGRGRRTMLVRAGRG